MKAFELYVRRLEKLVCSMSQGFDYPQIREDIKGALNGQVSNELRASVSLKKRKENGVFFTEEKLARNLSSKLLPTISPTDIIADPACGAGDLLLACADKLPLKRDLKGTLNSWGKQLIGFDIHPEFVRATKSRLVLLAIRRLGIRSIFKLSQLQSYFPLIKQRDFLAIPDEIRKASHIIINPPYNEMLAPSDCTWARGRVSAAGIFLDKCVSNAREGTRIGAILPDVLRSGSSSEKWRERIESFACKTSINVHGKFDKWTDVDVFFMQLIIGNSDKKRKAVWRRLPQNKHSGKVGDYFEVNVGAVVPHRDPKKGPSVSYIYAKTLPAWGKVKRINEKIKYSGRIFVPPFVVVRRTSRPGDKRAIGTILTGKRPVAIENHLLVLLPREKTVKRCHQLLRILRSRKTDEWLDKRIRCRHLTVESMKELPWWRQVK